MKPLWISFLNALALYPRLDFRQANEKAPATLPWIILVRALTGVCYALIAGVLAAVLRNGVLAAALAVLAAAVLHFRLTAGREADIPALLCRAILSKHGTASAQWESLAVAVPWLLMLALFLSGGALWLPTALALGTALGAELADSETGAFPFREKRAWLTASALSLVLSVLPHLLCRAALQTAFLRWLLLLVFTLLLTPWLKQSDFRSADRRMNRVFATTLLLLLTLLAVAL